MKINKLIKTKLNIDINGIKTDSREINNGDIFVPALGNIDKYQYIDEAIKNGAKLIITEKDIPEKIPYIKVDDINETLLKMLDRFYNYPILSSKLIGVTGTDGKTTTASIIRDMLKGASIGTNGLEFNDLHEDLHNTTPSLDKIYECFNKIKNKGINNIVMEVSSESYLTNRIPGLKFDVGIFTNITDEHLDKHPSFKNYFDCKMELIKNSKVAIINRDSKYFKDIIKYNDNYLTYGYKKSTLTIKKYKLMIDKTLIWFTYQNKLYKIESPLLGKFNIENLMASMLTLLALNYSIDEVIKRIKLIKKVPGRMETFNKKDKMVMIDYAHTINATKNILKFVKKYSKKRIITVVGCAGGRYKEKRSLIGKLVLKHSHLVIFTSDDPRNEKPSDIINDMISKSKKTNYYRIIDREEAVTLALRIATNKDIVLLLGKGRDNYMAIGNDYIEYSDISVIEKYFDSLKK